MSIYKNTLKLFRKELDDIISNKISFKNEVITCENLQEYLDFLELISMKTIHGKTIVFTNANGWYIQTLVKNLVLSIAANETFLTDSNELLKFGIICTDSEGYEASLKMNTSRVRSQLNLYSFFAKIPKLKVDTLARVSKTEDYLRLCFVKTVMIYHALVAGYSVIYIDPDMAMIKPSISYILDKMKENSLVLAGMKDANMNTNIIGVIPEEKYVKLFEVDSHTFEANLLSPGFRGGDEEFLIMKEQYEPEKIHFLDISLFPPGKQLPYLTIKTDIMMLHANGVSGLDNKIKFLAENNGWFL